MTEVLNGRSSSCFITLLLVFVITCCIVLKYVFLEIECSVDLAHVNDRVLLINKQMPLLQIASVRLCLKRSSVEGFALFFLMYFFVQGVAVSPFKAFLHEYLSLSLLPLSMKTRPNLLWLGTGAQLG